MVTNKKGLAISAAVFLMIMLSAVVCFAADVSASRSTTINYGTSGKGRPLDLIKIEPLQPAASRLLMVFEIHGFEDGYARDGQVLVDMGNKVAQYFAANPDKLGNTELYIIPSANPDGLADGWTNNGPGRCQVSKGVDINRDFSFYWIPNLIPRYKTLCPFSAPESRALRDLVIQLQPDDVIDVHGWGGYVKGTSSLTAYFEKPLGINRVINWNGSIGEFYAWSQKYATRTALIELPDAKTAPQLIIDSIAARCSER